MIAFALLGWMLMLTTNLPVGSAPAPVALPHFPDRLHAFVWRNWPLVPIERMARAVGAKPDDLRRMAKEMGLPSAPHISADQRRRSALTVIRRNWHLLPYEQLLQLLDWTPEQMAFSLQEDDFLYIKLGSLKPKCEPIRYRPPDAATLQREHEIGSVVHRAFPDGLPAQTEPLFAFVSQLKKHEPHATASAPSKLSPRFCYSYFALYGDPLLEKQTDPYPDGYLDTLAASGVNGVWLQAVLYKLAPFPWDPGMSEHYEERLANLRKLALRAKKRGVGIYLYLNEPRSMPLAFFEKHPELKGVVEGDHAALCTGRPEVRKYIADSIASICRAVPELAGFFTITASENLTNCWSHGGGAACPICGKLGAAEVIAGVNGAVQEGIRKAGAKTELIAWDWGWPDNAAEETVARLPEGIALMSVSEWSLPIHRGGIETTIGEYSLSTVGPGPRARSHWEMARKRGLRTVAKIQAANSWELSSVPYIPALENTARHAANIRNAQVDGLMLGWTLGGYPSPNLEVVAEVGAGADPETAMQTVARRRFGQEAAPAVVRAWHGFSAAFREFPFHGSLVYNAPMQYGPANLLWGEPTGYRATMVGFPYDDLDGWRAVYPPGIFIQQFEKVADGFEQTLAALKSALSAEAVTPPNAALQGELRVAEAAGLMFRSTANQARFVALRGALASANTADEARPIVRILDQVLADEIGSARRLYELQSQDSRLGFEASNQYFFVPVDLLEKILNCTDLRDRWLPQQRARFDN